MKSNHLNALRGQECLIDYVHPELNNHPEQAYQTTQPGQRWLAQQGIRIDR